MLMKETVAVQQQAAPGSVFFRFGRNIGRTAGVLPPDAPAERGRGVW
jgi:hypothetical protein